MLETGRISGFVLLQKELTNTSDNLGDGGPDFIVSVPILVLIHKARTCDVYEKGGRPRQDGKIGRDSARTRG